jgi:hypothetical protein
MVDDMPRFLAGATGRGSAEHHGGWTKIDILLPGQKPSAEVQAGLTTGR